MINLRTALAAGLLALTAGATAASAEPLTVTGRGENFAVQYSQGWTGNVLGGGFARTEGNGNSQRILYADPMLGQRASGLPVFTGGSEGEIAYLPIAPISWTLATN